ncbi:MAG: hypothetical protein FWD89_03520 [Firmicutes bacterium]|nr:hypothetical protein [Bacillota bacterium]
MRRPTMPVRPPQHRPPSNRPPQHSPRPPQGGFFPPGFPVISQGRIAFTTPFGRVPMHRLPTIFSEVVDRIPQSTWVWTFGERNGWTAVDYNGRFGFVDSRFLIFV